MAGNFQNNVNKSSYNEYFYYGIADTDPRIGSRYNSFLAITDDTDILLQPDGTGVVKSQLSRTASFVQVEIENESNTASSASRLAIETGGGSGGDPYILQQIVGVTSFTQGVDNSDDDKLVFSQDASLGTNNAITITADGDVNLPTQSAFLAYVTAAVANVTGDGSTYQVIFNSAPFNVGSNYNTGTGIYTAPISGHFWFDSSLYMIIQDTTLATGYITITTSNRTWQCDNRSMGNIRDYNQRYTQKISALVDMDSGDTAYITTYMTGFGSDMNDIDGSATQPYTRFSGKLIC